MSRPVTFLLSALLPLTGLVVGPAPRAEATGGAACVITGTMNFSPSAGDAAQGTWSIEPALISCQGIFRAYDRITGPGEFTGSGRYEEIPVGDGGCLQRIGSGQLDYLIPTTEADVRIREPHRFVLAGAGTFTSPSLNGSSQITPPFEGDCVSQPVTQATFLAEAMLVRVSGLGF